MLIQFGIIDLQLDKRKPRPGNTYRKSLTRTYRRHWEILQDLVLDKRGLALVAEQDTAVGAQHMEGHCDDTRKKKITISLQTVQQ